MKPRPVEPSVPRLLRLLPRSGLVTGPEADSLAGRWRQGSAAPDDVAAFGRWLIEQGYVTEFQLALLLHDHPDHFFFGPYKLLDRVGRGRLATVYKAVHRLGHVVALKVLPPARAHDPRIVTRFRQEAAIARHADHPNVVRGLDSGCDRGLHYLAMEYIEGKTLEQVLQRRGRLPAPEAAEVVRQALTGLAHLHDQEMVHRNLEPANLMLQGADDTGGAPEVRVKLLDFSLVRVVATPDQPAAGSSKGYEALALMAPQYRAAEMALDPFSADIRADIYTLGCVLYHALTGRPPYLDPTPVGQLIRHATEPPPPLRESAPDVPVSLERIVLRMMARSPERRYATPDQAARALAEYLAGTTVAPGHEAEGGPPPKEATAPWEPTPDTISVELVLPPAPPEFAWDAVAAPPADAPPHAGTKDGWLTGRDGWLLVAGGVGVLLAQLLGWLAAVLSVMRAGP